mmetsp:Transcript_72247/g.169985  ORF Transcript_72247/g.169985 Transcript_72247/m.169985 type:complete len:110 (-) Transcript_72247:46-375(-)
MKDYRTYECDKGEVDYDTSYCDATPGLLFKDIHMQHCCCTDLLRVAPKPGDALFFMSVQPTGAYNPLAGYLICPSLDKAMFIDIHFWRSPPPPEKGLIVKHSSKKRKRR